jgi:hypothetical protein
VLKSKEGKAEEMMGRGEPVSHGFSEFSAGRGLVWTGSEDEG